MDITKAMPVKEAVENGVWVEFDEETSFLIRSTECKEYTRAMQKHGRKLKGEQAKSIAAARNVTMKCLVDAIVIDWKGIEENGKKLPCTKENVEKVLEVPILRDFIADQAMEHANFQNEYLAQEIESVKKK